MEYVALGSSFASGPGIAPRVKGSPRAARRSRSNYAHLLAGTIGSRLVDVTSSGATTADILRDRQYGQPPQIEAVSQFTELVTVTIGGNDVGYVQMLTAACAPWLLRRMPRIAERLDVDLIRPRLDRVQRSLEEVAEAIMAKAPGARVAFVDYPTLLPPDPSSVELPISPEHAALGALIGHQLERATADATAATGAELVRASEASRDHHPWSAEPWTTGFARWRPGQVPFHPNAAGMAAVARLIADQLRS